MRSMDWQLGRLCRSSNGTDGRLSGMVTVFTALLGFLILTQVKSG